MVVYDGGPSAAVGRRGSLAFFEREVQRRGPIDCVRMSRLD